MNTLTVYSAVWCKHCGPFKEMLTRQGIEFTEADLDDKEVAKEAIQLGIRSLPTSVVRDSSGVPVYITSGTGSISDIKNHLGT